MPVDNGMIPDDDTDGVLAAAEAAAAPSGPPPEVASVEVLTAEEAARNGSPQVEVRGRMFRLLPEIPGMLLLQLTLAQKKVRNSPNKTDYQVDALAATGDLICSLVIEDEREEFIEACVHAQPTLGMEELMGMMRQMMEEITGRPTGSAPG